MPITIYSGSGDHCLKDLSSHKNIDIYIDTEDYHPNNNLKFYIQREADIIHKTYSYLRENLNKYDLIFCYDPTQLVATNVIKVIHAGTWLEPSFYESIDVQKKEYSISNLTGWKTGCFAYYLRHLLYQNQLAFKKFPITFYRSSAHIIIPEIGINPLIPKEPLSSKYILFEKHQFSIIIENTRERNHFSEKLMDCVITKTIPIYYGCANIEEYFDTTGWIILTNEENFLQDLYNELHKLNDTYYMKFIDTIEKNYKIAVQCANKEEELIKIIKPYLS
jgi:hypothetical protein